MKALRIKLLGAALAFLTVWPAVHIALTRTHGINPWKLAGWGMYSAPQLPVGIGVTGLTTDAVGRYELESLPLVLQPELVRFVRLRRNLGRLVEPKRLGRALLDHYTAIDGIEIEVVHLVLDRRTARLRETSERYRYLRSDPG